MNLIDLLHKKVEDYDAQYTAFAVFGIYNFVLSYVVWMYFAGIDNVFQPVAGLWFRLVAALLCVFLLFWKVWPKRLRYFLPLYWYFTLLYCLPFFFSYQFVIHHGAMLDVMAMLQITLFLVLLVDWRSFLILLGLGLLLGVLVGYAFVSKPILDPAFDYTHFTINYIFSIIMGMIFAQRKQIIDHSKLQTVKAVGSSIAHELGTPLASIRSGVSGAKELFHELVESYQLSRQAGVNVPEISQSRLKNVFTALDNVEAEAHYSDIIIRMLLMKVKNISIESIDFQTLKISSVIHTALERYPFHSAEQKNLILCNKQQDFLFQGTEEFMIHVLFNLLKNALYYVEAAGKGAITILCSTDENYNYLHVRDEGKGIAPHVLPHIFEQFYSNTPKGTGLGLFFCKMVMRGIGGDITCYSEEGRYTEFVLNFPHVKIKA